ncbi:alpha/beta fold hydrolase BchO [Litorisediminicola beolgyonensis]|uniref:Alpha/beta fold hydrolase BchO n=1 Tax=Litorisediminicola beolgyonensis TaxID=1173614 RepID=A0ABW3ZDD8_9RHOB
MDPTRDLAGWPHADRSRIDPVRPHRWHVQDMGTGSVILLLHGAGASTHSWRDVMPALAERYRVIAVDLPGHGFTRLGSRHRSSLDHISQDLFALLDAEDLNPRAIVGHSAGAAVALRLTGMLDETPDIVGINPALEPFSGLAGTLFPMAAKAIATLPFAMDLVRMTLVAPDRAERLLAGTGSQIDAEGVALYARLLRDRDHVEGALLMMSHWSLDRLLADLPNIQARTLFLTGANDRTVPPRVADDAAAKMPNARVETWSGLGHLLHEEAPERTVLHLREWLG